MKMKIKILAGMSLQEIHDIIKQGLESQQWQQSLDKWNRCMYRSKNGRKCAVGHILPDEFYTKHIEGLQLDGVLFKSRKCKPFFAGLNTHNDDKISFLYEMQDCHDRNNSPSRMKREFEDISNRYRLNP